MDVVHTNVTATIVYLTWMPPPNEHHNGIIRHYIVQVLEQETGALFSQISLHTVLILGQLHPYYTYMFTVAAVTVSTGPYSEPYSVRTLEDSKSSLNPF